MKRLLVATCLVLSSGPSYGEWELITVSEAYRAKVYVDYSTIRHKDNLVTMWELFDYETAQSTRIGKTYFSHQTQREYDCAEERTRILEVTWFSGHMGSSKVVESLEITPDWTPVARASIAEGLWIVACRVLIDQK
jgi:hypothetical protein